MKEDLMIATWIAVAMAAKLKEDWHWIVFTEHCLHICFSTKTQKILLPHTMLKVQVMSKKIDFEKTLNFQYL